MSKKSKAFGRLVELAQSETFSQQFNLIGEGASPTSCAQNAMVIAQYLTNQPVGGLMNGVRSLVPGGMTSVLTGLVRKRLRESILFYFELRFTGAQTQGGGDHHFCAFGLDDNRVAVAMGWQDLYTFEDWFNENDGGIYKADVFLEHLKGIETGSTKSVIDLCAFLGVAQHGKNKGRSVIQSLTGELAGFKPRIHSSCYLELP